MRAKHLVVLIGLAGLSLSAAPHPSPRAQPEQPKAEANQTEAAKPVPPPPIQTVEPVQSPELYGPCDEGQDQRNSDLCAQWKAADAARDAADWTRWGVILGIAGTIGLFWTLYYTRAAVKAAQEATQDADTALEIARKSANASTRLAKVSEQTARVQLRAYLAVTGIEIEEPELTEHGLASDISVKLANHGQTPATVTRLYVQFHWHAGDLFSNLLTVEKKTKFLLHRTVEPSNIPMFIWAHGDGLEEIGQILALIVVDYRDVFGQTHTEPFTFQLGDRTCSFNQLDLPASMNHFPISDYLDLVGLDENYKRKPKPATPKERA